MPSTRKPSFIPRRVKRWWGDHKGAIKNWLTPVFTVLIFLATGVYAVVAYFQWQTMQDSLELGRRQVEVANQTLGQAQQAMIEGIRPRVGVRVNLENGLTPGQPIVVHIDLLNEGNSSTDVEGKTTFLLSKSRQPPADYDGEMPFEAPAVLPHNSLKPVTVIVPSNGILTSSQKKMIEDGELYLYFYGRGAYTGIGGPYPLEFGVCWIPKRAIFANCMPLKQPPDTDKHDQDKAN